MTKKKRKRLTNEEKNKIIELYKQGYSTHKIAGIIGRSQTAVWAVLKEKNIKRRKRQILTNEQEREVCKLYRLKYKIKNIAEKYGIAVNTVHYIVNKYGVCRKRRNRRPERIKLRIIRRENGFQRKIYQNWFL